MARWPRALLLLCPLPPLTLQVRIPNRNVYIANNLAFNPSWTGVSCCGGVC